MQQNKNPVFPGTLNLMILKTLEAHVKRKKWVAYNWRYAYAKDTSEPLCVSCPGARKVIQVSRRRLARPSPASIASSRALTARWAWTGFTVEGIEKNPTSEHEAMCSTLFCDKE